MSDETLTGGLITERQDCEYMFCACAFVNPLGALEKCTWLDPTVFISPDCKVFWKGLKEHGDPMKAAADAHVLLEITKYVAEIPSSLYPENYATELLRLEYLTRASREISSIALAITQRDDNTVRDKVEYLHNQQVVVQSSVGLYPDEISSEFIVRINALTPSLLTGIEDLDYILGGLFMGELTILASRPGMGKSSLAMAIAQNLATQNKDVKILFFSLEMDRIQLWARMACAKTSHSWKDIRSGRADANAVKAVELASKDLEIELGDRLIIQDEVWDVPSMIAATSELKPSMVIIDHLGEIHWKDENADEVRWFGRAAKTLRTEIARRMHIPVLLIHQLNRAVEKQVDKRPVLSDLKWSGDLEAIADNVIMLYREDYYDNTGIIPDIVPLEMLIRKNRQGIMNSSAIVNFHTRTQKFSPARSGTHLPAIDNTPQMWYNKQDE